jgi:multidrug resistance efflux pump
MPTDSSIHPPVHSSPKNEIELKSPAVHEILGRPPRWIIRWGITVLLIIIGGIITGTAFFKYPDIITATIEVTTENLPSQLIARATGKLDTLFITDNQIIEKDKYLAVIENPANFDDIITLKNAFQDFNITNSDTSLSIYRHQPFTINHLPITHPFVRLSARPLTLGELQPIYHQFIKTYQDYEYFIKANYHNQKINAYRKQIVIQQKLEQRARKQSKISGEQLKTQENLFSIDSNLYAKNAIALVEYENARNTLFQVQQLYENALNSVENIQLNIAQYEHNIFDLQQQEEEKRKELLLALSGAYENLQAQINQWELQYVFKSPVAGKISLTRQWQPKQHINTGEPFVNIVPFENTKITGRIMLPAQGAGKVKKEQSVNVKFDGFPHMEFGMVRGFVKTISLVPIMIGHEKMTMLEVEFPNQLTTNYGKILDFSQEMSGTAEIITEDMRLLDRFLNPIKSLIKR